MAAAFRWHTVRQLDAVSRQTLARLGAAGAVPVDLAAPMTIDLDSTIVEVHGRGKQRARYGYHPQLAVDAGTGQVLFARLRGGNAGAARGAASFLTETVSRIRHAGASGVVTVRADSAFYSCAVLGAAVRLDVRFSVTIRQDVKVKAAIDAIQEQAFTPIPFWLSTPEVSGADVAETTYTCFAGTPALTPTPRVRWRGCQRLRLHTSRGKAGRVPGSGRRAASEGVAPPYPSRGLSPIA